MTKVEKFSEPNLKRVSIPLPIGEEVIFGDIYVNGAAIAPPRNLRNYNNRRTPAEEDEHNRVIQAIHAAHLEIIQRRHREILERHNAPLFAQQRPFRGLTREKKSLRKKIKTNPFFYRPLRFLGLYLVIAPASIPLILIDLVDNYKKCFFMSLFDFIFTFGDDE